MKGNLKMGHTDKVKVNFKVHSELPIEHIALSGNNPRIINENSFEFLELVNSIKAMGVIVPVHVRTIPKDKNKQYELLAGERRLLAAKKAGLKKINAINHGKISDEEAFEITFAENFARKDLTALEQGKAVATLYEKYKGDTKAVASKLGKSTSWVLQRRAIENDLVKEWKEKIATDPVLALWTAAHLQLIARYPADIQIELLEYYEYEVFDNIDGLISVKQLENELSEQLMLLSKAIFDIKDKNLNKNAGTCTKCNKRTSCRPGLFDDFEDTEKIKTNDRCLDKNCWLNKEKIFLQNRLQEERKKHKAIICVATDLPHYSKRSDLKQTYPNFIAEWKASKEGAKNAVPALVISGADAGQVRWVTILEKRMSAGTTQKVKGQPTPLSLRRRMLEAKRDARFLKKLEEIISKKGFEELMPHRNINNYDLVLAFAIVFGVDQPYTGTTPYHHNKTENKKAWNKVFELAEDSTIERLWESVWAVLCRNLRYSGPVRQTEKSRVDEAKQLAALFKLDTKAIYKEIRKEIPEPKSWKKLNADGTPKKKSPQLSSKTKRGDKKSKGKKDVKGKKSKKQKSKGS